MRRCSILILSLGAVLGGAAGCGGDDEPAIFPEDYLASYTEVRDCRFSLDHDLVRMRVLASPDALQPYMDRTTPFPTGAILLKEQFYDSDTTCAGPVINITAMQKLDVGADPAMLDWTWQRTDGAHKVEADYDLKRCTNCHTGCGKAPEGYDGTCTMP